MRERVIGSPPGKDSRLCAFGDCERTGVFSHSVLGANGRWFCALHDGGPQRSELGPRDIAEFIA